MDQPTEDVCPLCNRTTEGNTIYCDICGMWLHKKCEQISDMDYNTLEHSNLPYTCSICRPLDPSTQLPVSPQDYNAPSAGTLDVMPIVPSGLAPHVVTVPGPQVPTSQADGMDTNNPGPGPPVTTRRDPHQDNIIQENVATIQPLSDSTIPAIRPVTMTTMGNMVLPRAAQHLARHPTPVTNQHLTRNSTLTASQHLARQPTPAANQHMARQLTPPVNQHRARQLTPPANQHLARQPTPAANQHLARQLTPPVNQHRARQLTPPANQHLARQPTPAANQHLARQLTPPVNQHRARQLIPPANQHLARQPTPASNQHLARHPSLGDTQLLVDRERQISTKEKELKKRETQVTHAERRLAAQQALITELEAKVRILKQNNRLLKLQISDGHPATTSAPVANVTCSHSAAAVPPSIQDSLHRLEIEQMKLRMEQMSMSQQLLLSTMQTRQQLPQSFAMPMPIPAPWGPHPPPASRYQDACPESFPKPSTHTTRDTPEPPKPHMGSTRATGELPDPGTNVANPRKLGQTERRPGHHMVSTLHSWRTIPPLRPSP